MSFQSVEFNNETKAFETSDPNSVKLDANQLIRTTMGITVDTPLKGQITCGDPDSYEHLGVREVLSGDMRIKSPVLSTATNSGMVVRDVFDVKDSTIVTVNGIEMTARAAAAEGFIIRQPDGSYSESSKEGDLLGHASIKQLQPRTPEGTEASESYNASISSPEIEHALEFAAVELGHGAPDYTLLDRHAITAFSGLAKGDITGAASRLANATESELEVAEQFIDELYKGYRYKASQYISSKHGGINGEDVFNWASEHLPPTERASIMHMVYLGRSSVLDNLVAKYNRRNRG